MMNVKFGMNLIGVVLNFFVSMWNVFILFKNGVLFVVDYFQLELRFIVYFVNDECLCKIFNGGGDVFRMIVGEFY